MAKNQENITACLSSFSLDPFILDINQNKNFSFSRWGDGEWGLIFQKTNIINNIKKKYGDSVLAYGTTLKNIIESNPKYNIGIQPHAYRLWHDEISSLLSEDTCVSNADVFHRNSISNNLNNFFESLKSRNVILVGYNQLQNLKFFPFKLISVPDSHVWDSLKKLKIEVNNSIKLYKSPIILYSCSIAANILIDYFYNIYGDKITQLDTGSVWDPYLGIQSRKYHVDILNRLNITNGQIKRW